MPDIVYTGIINIASLLESQIIECTIRLLFPWFLKNLIFHSLFHFFTQSSPLLDTHL
jgi:hypothetical protein